MAGGDISVGDVAERSVDDPIVIDEDVALFREAPHGQERPVAGVLAVLGLSPTP